MKLPFSVEEFLGVFAKYNQAVWPLQIALYAFAVIVVVYIIKNTLYSNTVIFAFLAFFWFWTGTVYHLIFFSPINGAAIVFGILFIAQGLIFFVQGACREKMKLKYARNFSGVLGMFFILYALVLYPVLGFTVGHRYPAAPTFGVPCPTTIFTFGVLLFSQHRISVFVVLIPFLWSLIGFSAATDLHIPEDTGLVVAGISSTLIVLFFKPKATEKSARSVTVAPGGE